MNLRKISSNCAYIKLDQAFLLLQQGLEQEIETLKKKLAASVREKQNLHEELSEAYRIKGQLADLYSAEVSKNTDIEKQVKFFKGCIAAAFSERDHALMEAEKAKEQDEAVVLELERSRARIEEIESACADLWRDNVALQIELVNYKEKIIPFEQVVFKFYGIRQAATGNGCDSWEEKCACLLNDSEDLWSFDESMNSSSLQYIASLEEKLAATRLSVKNLQSKIQVDLEIEHHLKRKVRSLEEKIITLSDIAREGVLGLHNNHIQIRSDILTMLQDGIDEMMLTFSKLKDVMTTTIEKEISSLAGDNKSNEANRSRSNDQYADPATTSAYGRSIISNENFETSDALALALHEKVAALLLLSQQEERHLLDRDLNAALQLKISELQNNIIQVTNEKVTALMELADLKQKLQQLQENCKCEMKDRIKLVEGSKDVSSQLVDGRLKGLLKKTYFSRWIGKGITDNEFPISSNSEEHVPEIKERSSLATASSMMEIFTPQENIINVEHVASSVHLLRLSLLKAMNEATGSGENYITNLLDDVTVQAELIKSTLGTPLPVSSSMNAGENDIISNLKFTSPSAPSMEVVDGKRDALSTAAFEMAELLIMFACLIKETRKPQSSIAEAEADPQSLSGGI